MQKQVELDDYELDTEYDLPAMTIIAKGRFAPERRIGKNVFVLAPELAQTFPTDETSMPRWGLFYKWLKFLNHYPVSHLQFSTLNFNSPCG